MSLRFKKIKAFTLIEMLIVITIIGLIAFLGISTYGSAQKQAKLEFAADTIISLIRQQQALAKSGRVDLNASNVDPSTGNTNAASKKCYGLSINSKEITLIQTQYFPLKNNQADICDLSTLEEKPIDELQDFQITTLKQDGQSTEELLILFKPPNGKTLLGTKAGLLTNQIGITSDVYIGITATKDTKEKIIHFSPPTGFIERIQEKNT